MAAGAAADGGQAVAAGFERLLMRQHEEHRRRDERNADATSEGEIEGHAGLRSGKAR